MYPMCSTVEVRLVATPPMKMSTYFGHGFVAGVQYRQNVFTTMDGSPLWTLVAQSLGVLITEPLL